MAFEYATVACFGLLRVPLTTTFLTIVVRVRTTLRTVTFPSSRVIRVTVVRVPAWPLRFT